VILYVIALYLVQFVVGTAIFVGLQSVFPRLQQFDSPELVDTWPMFLVGSMTALVLTLLVTTGVIRWLDRRPLASLGLIWRRGTCREVLFGLGLGFVMISVLFIVQMGAGWIVVMKIPSADVRDYPLAFPGVALALAGAAMAEEIFVRGYVMQNLERQWSARPWGRGLAIGLSSLLFALAHALNPGFDLLVGGMLVAAGVCFAVAWYVVRSLWLPIALHFAWNATEGLWYGFPVSGLVTPKVIVTRRGGPELLTGGGFGPEGGLLVLGAYGLGIFILVAYGRWRAERRRLEAAGAGLATR
jgi:hypothetical protein